MLNKICTWTAKSAPSPPFSAERNLSPKTGTVDRPELRRVTQPPHIAGPLVVSLYPELIPRNQLKSPIFKFFKYDRNGNNFKM
jgi:hypothetical protein